jgi:peptidoglycan/xylan/chitin deacetylase (PgdA/CDA1 family)
LLRAGYWSGELGAVNKPAKEPGRRYVGLTFDDGYVSVLRHGLEALAQHGFRAVQFLPADMLGRTNEWDAGPGERGERIMSVMEVREWLAAGHEIGSHSCTHAWLTRVGAAQAREEIFASKKKLEDLFGRAIEHFCYPYGDWNAGIRELVGEAGYATACTTQFGVNPPGTDALGLRRMTVRYRSRNWEWVRKSRK